MSYQILLNAAVKTDVGKDHLAIFRHSHRQGNFLTPAATSLVIASSMRSSSKSLPKTRPKHSAVIALPN
jgi:hypothetical protein